MTDDILADLTDHLAARGADARPEWFGDPTLFAQDIIDWPPGTQLEPYQARVLSALIEHKRVAVRSPHGAGKSALAAMAILWFAFSRDLAGLPWKVLCTAGSWRQLEKYLMPEMALWARRLRWERLGRGPLNERTELLTLNLHLRHGQAFAAASDNAALMEGAHSPNLLIVLDESKTIPTPTWDALEGAAAGPESIYMLAISTPGAPAGRFFEIFQRTTGLEDWHPEHITLEESIAAGRINQSWADQRAKLWGTSSALYLNRVRGEFASSDESGVIPLAWVEAANARFAAYADGSLTLGPVTHAGVDIARSGSDKSVIALRHDDVISELRSYSSPDTMELVGHVAGILRAHPGCRAIVDVIGVGGGPVDRLREHQDIKSRITAFNASAKSDRQDASGELGFANSRAAAWWNMRERLNPDNHSTVALPPDDLLTGDLTSPRWTVNSSGRIQIESKDEIRKRLGRSTDSGDAVVQAFFDEVKGIAAGWMEYLEAEAKFGSARAIPKGYFDGKAPPEPEPEPELTPEEVEAAATQAAAEAEEAAARAEERARARREWGGGPFACVHIWTTVEPGIEGCAGDCRLKRETEQSWQERIADLGKKN